MTWIEARYRSGWRELTVRCAGVEVGGIAQHPETGRRSWWAQSGVA